MTAEEILAKRRKEETTNPNGLSVASVLAKHDQLMEMRRQREAYDKQVAQQKVEFYRQQYRAEDTAQTQQQNMEQYKATVPTALRLDLQKQIANPVTEKAQGILNKQPDAYVPGMSVFTIEDKIANAPSVEAAMKIHQDALAASPEYGKMFTEKMNQARIAEAAGKMSDQSPFMKTLLAGGAGVAEGLVSNAFDSKIIEKLGLAPRDVQGLSAGEKFQAMQSLDPKAGQIGQKLGGLAQMALLSMGGGVGSLAGEYATSLGASSKLASAISAGANMGVISALPSAVNGDSFKEIITKFGEGALGGMAAGYTQAAFASALGLNTVIDMTTKQAMWNFVGNLGADTLSWVAQTIASPAQLQSYIDDPSQIIWDILQNIVYFGVSQFQQRNAVKASEIDFTKFDDLAKNIEVLKETAPETPAHQTAKRAVQKSADAARNEAVKMDDPDTITAIDEIVRASQEGVPNAEVQAKAQEEVATKEIPFVPSTSRARVQTKVGQFDTILTSKEIENSPIRTQAHIDEVERVIEQHKNDKDLSPAIEEAMALLEHERTPEGRLKINLQLFALQSLAEKMGAKNVKRVLKNMFGENLENLNAKVIEILEKRDSGQKYEPLVVTYIKANNAKDWAKAEQIAESSTPSVLHEKLFSDDVMAPSEVMASAIMAKKLMESGVESDVVMGSAMLEKLASKATSMGQAIQSLAKVYREMGIIAAAKNGYNTSGIEKRQVNEGGKKIGETIDKVITDWTDKIAPAVPPKLAKKLTPEEVKRRTDEAWKKYEESYNGKLDKSTELAWKANYRKELEDTTSQLVDQTILPSEKLANTLDAFARSKHEQGPPEAPKPLLDLSNELLRLVKEQNPELGPAKIEGATSIDKLAFLVKNRGEYGKMLDDAFEMIESAYLKDPAKYPAEFMAEVHKYLNTMGDVRESRYRAAIKQAEKDMAMPMKDIIMDWLRTGKQKFQSLTDYIVSKSSLSGEDAKFLVDGLQKELDAYKAEVRDSILKGMFKGASKKTIKTLEQKLMDAVNLDIPNNPLYRDLWAEKMGISHLSSERAKDITDTLTKMNQYDPDKTYDVNGEQVEGWKIQQEEWNRLVQRMASDIKATGVDKILKVMHFGMLSNPASWAKNPLSNLAMMEMSRLANVPDAILQSLFVKEGNRTTSLRNWRKNEGMVKKVQDYYERYAKPDIKRTGMDMAMTVLMNQNKQTFKNAKAEWFFDVPLKVMEWGDIGFLKSRYEDAMGQYLEANHLSEPNQAAHEHAKQMALEDTFRDISMIATSIIGAKNGEAFVNKMKKLDKIAETATDPKEAYRAAGWAKTYRAAIAASRVAGQLIMPYVNTPVNIARRAYEYSPAGIASLYKYIGKGKFNPGDGAKISRMIAKSATGSIASFGLGALMSAMGLITGGYPDDPAEKKLWLAKGIKPYSFKVPGSDLYISLDWAAPMIIPFMMGASTVQEGNPIKGVNVFTDMSFVRSLNDIMNSDRTVQGKIGAILMQGPGQLIPNLMMKLSQSFDPIVRNSYDPDAAMASVNELLRKIPGASTTLQPKYDIWGEELKQVQVNEKMGSVGLLLNNIFIPWRYGKEDTRAETEEVARLFHAAQDAGAKNPADVLPDFSGTANQSMTDNGETIKLSAEQFALWQSTAGKYARAEIRKLMNDPEYLALPDYSETGASKWSAINKAYANAREEAKSAIKPDREKSQGELVPERTLSVNGKTYKITETDWASYESKRKEYEKKGYSNAVQLARWDVLHSKGVNYAKPYPKKESTSTKPTPTPINLTGG